MAVAVQISRETAFEVSSVLRTASGGFKGPDKILVSDEVETP